MAADTSTVSIHCDSGLVEEIEDYQEQRGHNSRSKAAGELLQIGLVEGRSPILHRLKDRTIEGAWHLSLIAVATLVIGVMTPVLALANAILIAAVMVAIGAALIAATELVRALFGHSTVATLLSERL